MKVTFTSTSLLIDNEKEAQQRKFNLTQMLLHGGVDLMLKEPEDGKKHRILDDSDYGIKVIPLHQVRKLTNAA